MEAEKGRRRGEQTSCSRSQLEQHLIAALKTKVKFRVFRLGSSASLTCPPAIDPLGAVL